MVDERPALPRVPDQAPPSRYGLVLRAVWFGLLAALLGWFSLLFTGLGAWTDETEPSAQLAAAAGPLVIGALLGAGAGAALGFALAGARRGAVLAGVVLGLLPTVLLVAGFLTDRV